LGGSLDARDRQAVAHRGNQGGATRERRAHIVAAAHAMGLETAMAAGELTWNDQTRHEDHND
jgi:hypothetical protein